MPVPGWPAWPGAAVPLHALCGLRKTPPCRWQAGGPCSHGQSGPHLPLLFSLAKGPSRCGGEPPLRCAGGCLVPSCLAAGSGQRTFLQHPLYLLGSRGRSCGVPAFISSMTPTLASALPSACYMLGSLLRARDAALSKDVTLCPPGSRQQDELEMQGTLGDPPAVSGKGA